MTRGPNRAEALATQPCSGNPILLDTWTCNSKNVEKGNHNWVTKIRKGFQRSKMFTVLLHFYETFVRFILNRINAVL